MANPGKIKHVRGTLRWPTAAEKILAGRVVDVFSHEAGVREGSDPEAVHDIRVALRRLQAAMRMFRACYPPRKLRRYRLRLRKLLRALGAVRDEDILIDALSNHGKAAPEAVNKTLARLVAERRTVQQQERVKSLLLLDKLRRANFAENLLTFVKGARGFKRADLQGPFTTEAAGIAQKALAVWDERRKQVQGRDDLESLHQMRIAVKRLRYTLELSRLANGDLYPGCLGRLTEMQQVLGDLHDADMLLNCLAHSLPNAPIEAIGGLADVMRTTKQTRQELAARFSKLISNRNLGPFKAAARVATGERRSRSPRRRPNAAPDAALTQRTG
jgi:CHAD domain-containing protein